MKVITFIMLLLPGLLFGQGGNTNEINLLTGIPVNKVINLGDVHVFNLALEKNQLAIIKLTNYTLDLSFLAITSNGFVVEETETFDGTDTPIFYANKKDNYRVEIAVLNNKKKKGKYSISLEVIESKENNKIEVINLLLSRFYSSSEPGASVSIIKKGVVVYNKSFGLSNLNDSEINTNASLYNLASVSKQFTAFGIAMLANQKKLSLNDDIRKHLPELPEYKNIITIDNLIHHTGGLYENDFPLALAGYDDLDYTSKKRELMFLYRNKNVIFKPGSRFQYSNTGYTLLGEIMSRVTKQPFSEWVKANIFIPLQMNNTMVMDNVNLIIKKKSESYLKNEHDDYELSSVNSEASGASNVYSSISDLRKWIENFDTGKIGNDAILQLVKEKGVLNNGDILDYAFGNWVTEFKGIERISHLGLTAGYRTSIARFPSQQLSVVYLANNGAWKTFDLAGEIYAILLSDEIKLKQRVKRKSASSLDTINETSSNFDVEFNNYVGVFYSDELLTSYEVVNVNAKLYINSISHGKISLSPVSKDIFSTNKWFFSRLVFIKDNKDRVIGFETYSDRDGTSMYFQKVNLSKY